MNPVLELRCQFLIASFDPGEQKVDTCCENAPALVISRFAGRSNLLIVTRWFSGKFS